MKMLLTMSAVVLIGTASVSAADGTARPTTRSTQAKVAPLSMGVGTPTAGDGVPSSPMPLAAVPQTVPPRDNPTAAGLVRLPPVTSPVGQNRRPREFDTSSSVVDGTWREDGQHILININGQQLRLEKSGPSSPTPTPPAPPAGGEVEGRLSHRGHPLVHCTVALLPLSKSGSGYHVNGEREPPVCHTDSNGVYRFPDVPPGAYKLTWLPEGTRQWIRRVKFHPDVHVKAGQVAHAKEIRRCLQTLN